MVLKYEGLLNGIGLTMTLVLLLILLLDAPPQVYSLGKKSRDKTVHLNLTFDQGTLEDANALSHDKVVVCYLGTWAKYRPDAGAFDLEEHFDPSLCTHLVYSFAGINNSTLEMVPLDPFLDLEDEYGKGWFKKATTLKKKHPHLKVLLAVGGWNEGSKKYSEMAEDESNRSKFIKSAVEIIRKNGFDGLDLDWEYPGRRGGGPGDKKHFVQLVQGLRAELDKYGLMLTAAFGASKEIADSSYDLPVLSSLLDHIHLMCYDYHGSWDNLTYHNAPMFNPSGDTSVQFSLQYFLKGGINPKKLVLGLPLYGRTFLLTHPKNEDGGALRSRSKDKGFQGPYTREDGFLGYNEICQKLASDRGDWKTYWDSIAQVPYMRNELKWVSFDNPDSLMRKVDYALSLGLKGAMVWSIDTDDFHGTCGGPKNPLLRSINYALSRGPGGHGHGPIKPSGGAPGQGRPNLTLLATITIFTTITLNYFSS